MDYDLTHIPAGYDRGRDHGPEFLGLWMTTIERHLHALNVRRILELGCGTGGFSEAFAIHFGAEVIGIDPSVKMLERAVRSSIRTSFNISSVLQKPFLFNRVRST
jgi:SAM-dependent methyltransferase